jgi:DNA helicase-2/ATP-dependent DNA helicase PcrA
MELTKNQQQAVEYNDGPTLIIAGAGTGKTTVIVEKIKYLISNKLSRPDEILALTFTDKSAREMEERVDKAMPYGLFQMEITTFHSFCDHILRDECSQIGISPAYKLQTQAGTVNFLKRNIFNFDLEYFRPLGNPNKFIEGLISHFSRLKDENVLPDEYIKWAINELNKADKEDEKLEAKKYLELAHAYKKFEDLKIKNNLLDFSDLIYFTIRLFSIRKNVLEKYKKRFKHVLVDEFQDTNFAQYELIKMLSPKDSNPHLTVIGDDNQSIYKFRGASISNILQFIDDYPKAKQVVLLDNYRSNQEILDVAYQLIQKNNPDTLESKLKISKDLKSHREKSKKKAVVYHLFNRGEDEAEYIVSEIRKLKLENYKYRDTAILVRTNSQINLFIQALSRNNIPHQVLGPNILFKQPEIKDLIAVLKTIYNVNDSASFYRVLNMDIFDIDIRDIASLISFTKNTHLSLFETVEAYLSFENSNFYKPEYEVFKKHLFLIREDSKKKLEKIIFLIHDSLKLIKKETVGHVLYEFLDKSEMLGKMMSYKTDKEERTAINISNFFNKIKAFESENEDASLFAFVDYLEISLELGESPMTAEASYNDYDAVNILTVHSSKGLEFPIVFMGCLTADKFPTRERKDQIPIPEKLIKEILPSGDFHNQEERRLFYVGLTRAKDKIFLTSANSYTDAKRLKKISPFVFEAIGEKNVLSEKLKKETEKKQLSILDYKPSHVAMSEVNNLLQSDNAKIESFSYSQIEAYESCPLKYKYQYVLKIPTLPSGVAASFGSTLHKALQRFYKDFKDNTLVDLDKLLSYMRESWIPLGYTSKNYEEKMKSEGIKSLTDFYNNFHNESIDVVDLEKFFKIKISDDIMISGVIDRVDKIGKDKIEIIDYKTGKMPEEKKLKKNMQLSIYALAATDKNLYGKKLENVSLSLYYLQENKKISIEKTEKDIHDLKEEIREIAEEINRQEFKAKPSIMCDFCPFKINCEAWQ